jgi:hypothetical protein
VLRLVFRRSWAAVAILQVPFALLELIVSVLAPRIARLESFQGTLYLTMAGFPQVTARSRTWTNRKAVSEG